MPSVITGDPSGISNTLTRTITNATNASPIVITTSVAHLFATGDTVVNTDVVGNTAANGTFRITKISSTTFSLDGSTGNGAYVSGGTTVDASLTPQFSIPTDGDPMSAASINVAFEALADRTQYLALIARLQVKEFTASGSWVAPDDCQQVGLIVGCGGGGGGGKGTAGAALADRWSGGGGGGGGAPLGVAVVALSAGQTYDVTIGAGGTGDTTGGTGGTAGGTSGVSQGGNVMCTFIGGGGGSAGANSASSSVSTYCYAPGGTPASAAPAVGVQSTTIPPLVLRCASMGGWGLSNQSALAIPVFDVLSGGTQAESSVFSGTASGALGVPGTDSGSHRGGGQGGNGAGGAFGPAPAGSNGGDGNSGGAGTAGAAGAAGGANTGAGGSGGGAGGAGTSGGAGGNGGNGGSGRIRIYYFGSPS